MRPSDAIAWLHQVGSSMQVVLCDEFVSKQVGLELNYCVKFVSIFLVVMNFL